MRSRKAPPLPNNRSSRTPETISWIAAVRTPFAARASAMRFPTPPPTAQATSIAGTTGASARIDSLGLFKSSVTASVAQSSTVSQASMVVSRTPTPTTSTSPTLRAISSPTGVACTRAMGQERTPRTASARRSARMRAFAVMRNHRFSMRGPSVANVPARKRSADHPTRAAVASPREKAMAESIAAPSRSGGSTAAVFIAMPAREPTTRRHRTGAKYRLTSRRKRKVPSCEEPAPGPATMSQPYHA